MKRKKCGLCGRQLENNNIPYCDHCIKQSAEEVLDEYHEQHNSCVEVLNKPPITVVK